MGFPVPKKRPGPVHRMGADFARSVSDELALSVTATVRSLSIADQNRVLLNLASFIATQLEALETNNEPEAFL